MLNLTRRYGPLALMLILAGLSYWILQELEPEPLGGGSAQRHIPDYYMENFTTTTMGENGKPQRRIEAHYMAHFPDTDTHEFDRPYLTMYRDKGPPWHVRSERGWLSASGDVMLLLGKVNIWRNDADGAKALDIKTEDLRVLPETSYGETDRPVTITTPESITTGTGMKAYLEESRLELLSEVRTRYESNKR